MKQYIVYIPGLGDGYDVFRRLFLSFWRIFGVTVEHVPMSWYDGKPYEEKYERAMKAIKNAQALGFTVSVIGESAGATMAMNLFAKNRSIHRFVSLCGVNSATSPISSRILKRGPAFKESVSRVAFSRAQAIKSRASSMSVVTAKQDSTVPVSKNLIPGARHLTLWSMGHQTTVLLGLTIYSFVLVREVRRSS